MEESQESAAKKKERESLIAAEDYACLSRIIF